MANHTAADMVGLTLYAKKRIPLFRWGAPDAQILGYIEQGKRIGIIRSWVRKQSNRNLWFWEFDDPQRSDLATFYVAHIPETLNMPRLKEDMEERDEAMRRRQLEWYQRLMEDTGEVLQQGGSSIMTGALILGGLYVLGRAITK